MCDGLARKTRGTEERDCSMTKILFVCLGNICRSPMAQFVFQYLAEQKGLAGAFQVDSAATSREEIGNPVHPGTLRELARQGIPAGTHFARQMTREDYQKYDWLIGMETQNIRNMLRIVGEDPEGKVRRLLDFTDRPRDIADPWFTGKFALTYQDIREGCEAMLQVLSE